jgi:hypothetical protein
MTCLSPDSPGVAARPPAPRRRGALAGYGEQGLVALALCGVALLAVPGLRYRIDGSSCASWPPVGQSLGYAAVYLLALLLLTVAWLGLVRRASEPGGPSLRRVLVYAALVHAVALLVPPFLSDDPLFYAALSRVLAAFHGSAYTPLCQTLPAGDPFLTVLTPSWQCGTSAYFPGFHWLALAIGRLAGTSLTLHLRLYQLAGASLMLLTAWVAGAALAPTRLPPALGAALLAWNPIAVIEGTINAHNDALLALGCAGFACFVVRQRPLPALACLLACLAVKASAGLLLGMYGLSLLFGLVRRRWPAVSRRLPWALGVALAVALVAIALLRAPTGGLNMFTALIGSPADPWDYCTRSLECLPRVILRWLLLRPTAAWKVGLGFRALAAGWLLWCAWRAERRPLTWLATGLFIYYLLLHGWAQTWYLLPLLPLLPFASAATAPAMRTVCVSGCAYYGGYLIGGCVDTNLGRGVVDLLEGLATVAPPAVALWRYRNRTDG